MKLIRRFWSDFLRPHRRTFLTVGGLMVLSVGMQLPTPLLTMYIIDSAVESMRPDRITQLALVLVALVIARHVFSYLNDSLTLRLKETIILDVETSLVRHLQSLPLSFFTRHQSTYLQARLMNDSREIEGALVRTVVTVLMDSLTFVVGSVIILAIRFELGLVLLLSLVPFFYIRYFANGKMRLLSAEMQERHARASATLSESFAGIRTIKALTQEGYREQVAMEKLSSLRNIYVRTNWFGILSTLGASFVTSLSVAFVLWFGLHGVLDHKMTLGEVVGVLSMLTFLYSPVNSFVAANLSIQRARSALHRIYEFLMLEPEAAGGEALDLPRGDIELRGVTFGYTAGSTVLRDVDLKIAAGETLALVGRSGAGKTTVVNLLLRFYSPDAGSVLLDGRDVRTLSLESLRRSLGLVDQSTFLFTGTVLDNLRLGSPDATFEEVVKAAKRSHAHEFIESLPEGYGTRVGERGVGLSGGQCQRIALARLFLRDPAVLILDEAVSAVDSESEESIQSALAELARDRTTIIIAHRLSSLMLAERVVLLEDGRLAEEGRHSELMARGGAYERLFHQQFRPQQGDIPGDDVSDDADDPSMQPSMAVA